VSPVRAPFLDETDCACSSRPKIDGNVSAKPNDLVMRFRQRHVEKALRVEYRLRGPHEEFLHDPEARFRGFCAVRMTTHSVEHQHERRFVRYDDGSAILVVLAITEG
jgi:hypothetical protein